MKAEATLWLSKADGSGGLDILQAVADTPGLYRAAKPWAPGTYRIVSGCEGYEEGELVLHLSFERGAERAKLLVDPVD